MNFNRRQLLQSAAAFSLLPGFARASVPLLVAAETEQQIAPGDYGKTRVWSYGGGTPGPEIRVAQGARVQRRLINNLPQPTAVHWHGIRIENAMDGVPGFTQDAVPPNGSFDYDFVVPDAGAYWYHSHNRSMEQVARGLYGPLIVEESEAPDVDRDMVLMLDDWRIDPETVQITDDFDNGHDLSHAGRIGNLVTANGQFDPSFRVKQNERLRLRLINASNARIFNISLDGLSGWLVALDGMPLEQPVQFTEVLPLAPAQRMDLFLDVVANPGEVASLVSIERGAGFGLARFDVAEQAAKSGRKGVKPLPPNPLPEFSEGQDAPVHRMTMQGGAMRWLESAKIGEETLSGRELAQLGRFWALNGFAERPTEPFLDISKNSEHRIDFVNETAFPHAMHLHGHHFRLVSQDGTLGNWRDTVLVNPGETRQIALKADNPGDWLLHCHMLGHAASGMMSWFRVT